MRLPYAPPWLEKSILRCNLFSDRAIRSDAVKVGRFIVILLNPVRLPYAVGRKLIMCQSIHRNMLVWYSFSWLSHAMIWRSCRCYVFSTGWPRPWGLFSEASVRVRGRPLSAPLTTLEQKKSTNRQDCLQPFCISCWLLLRSLIGRHVVRPQYRGIGQCFTILLGLELYDSCSLGT